MVDAVASDYGSEVTFIAVAGRSSPEASEERVGSWFSPDRVLWGYDDELWGTYAIRGQPASVLIDAEQRIVRRWFGPVGGLEMRAALDELLGQ